VKAIIIVYKGKRYRRNPKAKQRCHRVYYWHHDSYSSPKSLHRQVYIDNHGPIPFGMHVHHKDHDPFNNFPTNLELIEPGKHSSHHLLTPARRALSARTARMNQPATKAWHASAEGRAWHRKHAQEQWKHPNWNDRTCEECEKHFRSLNKDRRFCSMRCMSRNWHKRHPDYRRKTAS
jgi:hypothetical protein